MCFLRKQLVSFIIDVLNVSFGNAIETLISIYYIINKCIVRTLDERSRMKNVEMKYVRLKPGVWFGVYIRHLFLGINVMFELSNYKPAALYS